MGRRAIVWAILSTDENMDQIADKHAVSLAFVKEAFDEWVSMMVDSQPESEEDIQIDDWLAEEQEI